MKGSATPLVVDESIIRSKDPVQLFDDFPVIDNNAHYSESLECAAFRKFGLFLKLDSTSTPTTIRFEVEFLDRWTGQWYTYKQGVFVSLYWEDVDVASIVYESFAGDCLGRAVRLKLTGAGCTSSAYFTISAAMEFWN